MKEAVQEVVKESSSGQAPDQQDGMFGGRGATTPKEALQPCTCCDRVLAVLRLSVLLSYTHDHVVADEHEDESSHSSAVMRE
ncbi:hypothetical protein E2C01_066236 [Portunus trituberculatus]|uniref:Uncharacterized protein n=1 Tax=Portunus trituberculatus TaxID=210409 RepID=A0A5B7HU49_PORTR|nr:hypothetical protein [Portunus trituberculatus]